MKKIIALCLVMVSIFCLCGCTKAENAQLTDIATKYQIMANNNIENDLFKTGLIVNGGGHFDITYSNNLTSVIAQLEAEDYVGDGLVKYQRYERLSVNGYYPVLLDSVWSSFYIRATSFKTNEFNDLIPQEIRTQLYNNLGGVESSLKKLVSAKNNLENVTARGIADPISSASQNSLSEYFSRFNNLLLSCLEFSNTFDDAVKHLNSEPEIVQLPMQIETGSVKIVIDRTPLKMSEYFIYQHIVAHGGFDDLTALQKSDLSDYITYYSNYQTSISLSNIAKYETLTGKDITDVANISYTALRNKEKDLLNERETFIEAAKGYQQSNTTQKELLQINLNNFRNDYVTYFNYADDLLLRVLNI